MEMEADVEESPNEDNVLYNLTIHAEWTQEPETVVGTSLEYSVNAHVVNYVVMVH